MGEKEIRLIGNNIKNGIYSYSEAKTLSNEMGLDLVLVTTKGVPHVYKLVDRKKDLYEQKLRKQEQQKNSKKTVVKEIRIGANIGDHDYEIKKKQLIKFLKKDAKVKISMLFHILLLKLATELEDYGKVETMPKLLGKKMFMQIVPK
jgi:translation initiation factor IF-3